MSGGKPVHMHRRVAVYAVRFRVPVDMIPRLGMTELRRSLMTKDAVEARRRCLKATIWFRTTMETLRAAVTTSRADLEHAAKLFFAELTEARLRPLDIPRDAVNELDRQTELSLDRIRELDDQARRNDFDKATYEAAARLAAMIGVRLADLSEGQRIFAAQLAARAEREQHRLFVRQIADPVLPDRDDLFSGAGHVSGQYSVTELASRSDPAPSVSTGKSR